MEEIKVGEYIRTPYYTIEKVIEIEKNECQVFTTVITDRDCYQLEWLKAWNTKYSPNIIDLIEEGDYVNGYKVEKINDGFIYCCESNGYYKEIIWKEKDIKTIVTKEQFENISYRLEE